MIKRGYYPFGLKHKGYNNNVSANVNSAARKFMFGGKEYQDELGLGWYDISARNYDPALGRWMNLDPLAEEMRRFSPYNYAFDSPIYWIDYDGMSPSSNNSCCGGDPPKDPTWGDVLPVKKIEPFVPSQKTVNLFAEGKDLLSKVFDGSNVSADSKLGVGGELKVLGAEIKLQANMVSGKLKVDKDKAELTLKAAEFKGEISYGSKENNVKASAKGELSTVKASVDKNLNVNGSMEGGGFDSNVTAKGEGISVSSQDLLTVKATTKIGTAKVTGSVDLYSLGKGLKKIAAGGVSWLGDYISNVLD